MNVEFGELIRIIEANGGSASVVVYGDIGEIPLSLKVYAVLERDLSSIDRSVSVSAHVTEADFTIVAEGIECKTNYRKIRFQDVPQYERRMDPESSELPAFMSDFAAEHDGADYREYGILNGECVTVRIRKESYRLPPRPPSFKPETKTNTVLLVERRAGPDVELSPVYRHWTY